MIKQIVHYIVSDTHFACGPKRGEGYSAVINHRHVTCVPCLDAPLLSKINAPKHYVQSGVEPIVPITAWKLGFCLGNVVKYIARAKHKGTELEDLKKAAWYLAHEITQMEKDDA